VAGGQVLVVADGAAVLADPGEDAFHDPASGHDLEGVPVAPGHDLKGDLEGGGPGGELAGFAGVAGVGSDQRTRGQARRVFHSTWRSWAEAGVMTTSRTKPVVSAAMWRLRPLTFLAASQPGDALGTVSAARTGCESMNAAVGSVKAQPSVLSSTS
jgi:hypothetical protein